MKVIHNEGVYKHCSKEYYPVTKYHIPLFTGADFNNVSFITVVQAGTRNFRIDNIIIVNDNKNERKEIFVLVAVILGQAADVACFQLDENSPCKIDGHIGGTQLVIRDNDNGKHCIIIS